MQIRNRLTYQFVAIVAFIQLFSSLAIYLNSADYRKSSFYEQLKASALNKTVLLMELEGLEPERLEELRELGVASLTDERFFVYNFKNELLYSSDVDSSMRITTAMLDKVRVAGELRFEQGDYELAGMMFADRYNRLVVVSAAKDLVGFEQLRNLRRVLIAVFIFSLLFLMILAWIYAGQALRPIRSIIGQVDQITFTNLNERLNDSGSKDELSSLTATFNSMLERIEGSLAMQRNFVANASHELRTPLTAIQGQLEVVLLKSRSEQEYRDKIQSVLDDIRNLTGIANRLLMLAQADSEYAARLFKPIPLVDVLWQCQADIQKRQPKAVIHITLDDDLTQAEDLQVPGNEQLLGTVFTNLIENAIKFSHRKEVFVDLKGNDHSILVAVRDEGIGIPEAEMEQVFQPFFRSSNAQQINGHGIGLSLVERILRLHNGKIKVQSKEGRGTTFTVQLQK
jgi:signal transduction histidine kinase